MIYALMGWAHAAIARRAAAIRALAGERGQGTVEYVGLSRAGVKGKSWRPWPWERWDSSCAVDPPAH